MLTVLIQYTIEILSSETKFMQYSKKLIAIDMLHLKQKTNESYKNNLEISQHLF